MNNLENLKDYIEKNLESIKITDDIKNDIIKKSKINTYHNFKYGAVIALPILLILLISYLIFREPISYATQKVLRYVPGINKLIYTSLENQAYGLLGSVEMSIGEKYIKVNSAYTEGNTVTLIVEGNVPLVMEDNAPLKNKIIAIDEYKNVAELTSWDMIWDGDRDSDNYQWSGRIIYTFNDVVKRFNIIYGKYKMPIIMTKLPEVFPKDYNYISIKDIGINIAVITNYVEDKLEVSLLAQVNDPTKMISFPLDDIYLLNDKGEKYYCVNNNSENILYFDRKLESSIKLVIPYILIEDTDLKTKVTISKNDKLPINIKIGDNDLIINNVQWAEYIERFNYKTPEKDCHLIEKAAQKVKLIINKNLIGTNELKLYNISASVDEKELNKYIVEGVKCIFVDPSEENDSKVTNDNYKELVISNIKKGQHKITVTFTNPIFYTTKEVIIPIQP
ncbi:hypothetical protein [Caminicella sporogenes]|uniref:hypothetical protein n=1 Tax=Caminicella sporogenes TaxID=166485 RepID=UPI002540EABC|nr:hypothetical protein [Caminicella sporogenes]WIF94353.1 hypothetical protein QNI18_08765 [Caminicella sporogenes]